MKIISLDSISKSIISISREIINKYYEDERDLFYPVWAVMKEQLSKWINSNPSKWGFEAYKRKSLAIMEFGQSANASNLVAPGIIAMTAGVLWNISSMDYKPEEKDIVRIIDDCSKIFKISSSLTDNLKEFLVPLCVKEMPNILKISKKEIIWGKRERIEEGKVEESKPKAIRKEDTLEIGISDGKPFVKINGKEAKEFCTKYKQFVNFVLLAVAKKKSEGWLHRADDLDLGESDQALSDIRQWIARYIEYVIEPKNVIKSSEKEEKKIRLDLFNPQNIKIQKSICEFRSKSESRVRTLVMKAEQRRLLWDKGILQKLLDEEELEQLDRESAIMWRQMTLIQKAVEKMDWQVAFGEFNKLWIKCEEIFSLCKYKRKYF